VTSITSAPPDVTAFTAGSTAEAYITVIEQDGPRFSDRSDEPFETARNQTGE
jgi:hypothetical protein